MGACTGMVSSALRFLLQFNVTLKNVKLEVGGNHRQSSVVSRQSSHPWSFSHRHPSVHTSIRPCDAWKYPNAFNLLASTTTTVESLRQLDTGLYGTVLEGRQDRLISSNVQFGWQKGLKALRRLVVVCLCVPSLAFWFNWKGLTSLWCTYTV